MSIRWSSVAFALLGLLAQLGKNITKGRGDSSSIKGQISPVVIKSILIELLTIKRKMRAISCLLLVIIPFHSPAIGQDLVLDGDGADGVAGVAGLSPPNGLDSFQAGGDGGPGMSGGNGGDGVSRVEEISNIVGSGLVFSGNGGDGGPGGVGGNGGRAGPSGDGGNGGPGGQGGDGGDGATLVLKVNAPIDGDITVRAVGGAAGSGGIGGNGGNAYRAYLSEDGGDGGNGTVGGNGADGGDAFWYTGPLGGDGGDGVTPGAGGAGGLGAIPGTAGQPGAQLQAYLPGAAGTPGAGGNITVEVSAQIGGNIVADAGTGIVNFVVNTAGSVWGTIQAAPLSTSTLTLNLDVIDRDDFERAASVLDSNVAGGTITVDGKRFAWTGFDTLVNGLRFTGVRPIPTTAPSGAGDQSSQPAGNAGGQTGNDRGIVTPISAAIVTAEPRAVQNPSETGIAPPAYLACRPRAVTAFPHGSGIRIVARPDGERPAFVVGQIEAGRFLGRNPLGWRASVLPGGSLSFTVADASGQVLATCT